MRLQRGVRRRGPTLMIMGGFMLAGCGSGPARFDLVGGAGTPSGPVATVGGEGTPLRGSPALADTMPSLPAGWLGQANWWEDFEQGTASWSLQVTVGRGSWRVERFGACGAALVVRLTGAGEAIADMPLPSGVLAGSRFRAWLAGQGSARASVSLRDVRRSTVLWEGDGTPGYQPVPVLARCDVSFEPFTRLVWQVRAAGSSAVALDDLAELQPTS